MTIKNNTQEANPTRAVFIHGPQGCGKSVNSLPLAVYYGKKRIFDEQVKSIDMLRCTGDAIVFSQEPLVPDSIPFADAIREAGLACGPKKVTIDDIKKNNARTLYVKCKAAQEDLAEVAANFGKNSDEYKNKLKQTKDWLDSSFPDLLELAISHLISSGHGN